MKQEKGITLIALVITIIVLLILAGVSIAMLTSDNSAPARANEAAAKDAVAAAKDQCAMIAMNALTEYYNTTYVANGSSSSITDNGAQVKVVEKLTGKTFANVEMGALTTSGSDVTFKLTSTKDRSVNVTGTISAKGSLTWGDWTTN